ncbi:Right-handed parallel beta-helix repeat-containing protein [Mycena venus]|uniref:Right-handed parallel beta-helix repeat-containing protein n=1 Tax=Mycena venus TaxID=2733690 RepID=A0A8H6XGZ7_9AGAR|nr:Right-handed parallel beta-helix repeat-containing protein [Mycena venus]
MSVLIDDSNPLVQYNSPGGWIVTGKVPEFEVTTHASATPGDTATLAFEGTSISVYGTVAESAGQSRLNFSIDGVVVGSYQAPAVTAAIHNTRFWTSPVFQEAPHELTVTVDQDTSLNSLDRTFFLDYFVYNTASAAGKTVLFDDNDASLVYSPNWQANTNSDSSLQGTEHVSTSAGAWVALSFEGTQISLFGPSSQKGLQASVVIDGSDSQSGVITQSKTQNQLFTSAVLPLGHHTINVTLLTGDSTAIDYFLVASTLGTPTTPTTLQLAGTPSSSPPSGTPASDGAQTPVSSSLAASQGSKAPPIAAIVGGAVGGLVLLLLLLIALLMWRRRSRRVNQLAFAYPAPFAPHPWAGKRVSVSSMTTLTEVDASQRPKSFEKQRPASRYIYYE